MESFLIFAAIVFIGLVVIASIQQASRKRSEGGQTVSSTAEQRREMQNNPGYTPPRFH